MRGWSVALVVGRVERTYPMEQRGARVPVFENASVYWVVADGLESPQQERFRSFWVTVEELNPPSSLSMFKNVSVLATAERQSPKGPNPGCSPLTRFNVISTSM